MRKLLTMVLVATLASLSGAASAATEEAAATLDQPRPRWYTEELEARVLAAGTDGVEVALSKQQQLELNCLGTSPPSLSATDVSMKAVSAGGCMVAPHGCTMNFIFADDRSKYIGTAGHCVQGGSTVVMQVATRISPMEPDTLLVTLAVIGKVAKRWDAGIGKDFALVKIDPNWPVVSGVSGVLGPTGVFCGDPLGQPVVHYGHGYAFFVAQGYPKFGEVVPDVALIFKPSSEGFNWVGYGLPGDSGSGVMNDLGLAVGDLTHGMSSAREVPVPGLNFGTTMQAIFKLIGPSYSLVTVDGRSVNCSGVLIGV